MRRASTQRGEGTPSTAPRGDHALPLHLEGPCSTTGSWWHRWHYPEPGRAQVSSRVQVSVDAEGFPLLVFGTVSSGGLQEPKLCAKPSCSWGILSRTGWASPGCRVGSMTQGHLAQWRTPGCGAHGGCASPAQHCWQDQAWGCAGLSGSLLACLEVPLMTRCCSRLLGDRTCQHPQTKALLAHNGNRREHWAAAFSLWGLLSEPSP